MKARVNRELLNQLLKEMGVPEKRTKSLKVVVLQEMPNSPSPSEMHALSKYNVWRNTLTLHPYKLWEDWDDYTKAVLVDAIAHESCHIKQGWWSAVPQLLWAAVSLILISSSYILLNSCIVQLLGLTYWLSLLLTTVVAVKMLPSILETWLPLSFRYIFPRMPHEREADRFADQALSDLLWREVIEIEEDV